MWVHMCVEARAWDSLLAPYPVLELQMCTTAPEFLLLAGIELRLPSLHSKYLYPLSHFPGPHLEYVYPFDFNTIFKCRATCLIKWVSWTKGRFPQGTLPVSPSGLRRPNSESAKLQPMPPFVSQRAQSYSLSQRECAHYLLHRVFRMALLHREAQ